jgi:AcrR family transcriptional regulator
MAPKTPEQFHEIRQRSSQKIKEAAFDLFGEVGFKSTTIQAIAKRAGISKGLIYNYFESKEAILESILSDFMQHSDDVYEAGHQYPDPRQELAAWIDASVHYVEHNTKLLRVMIPLSIETATLPAVHEMAKAKAQHWYAELERVFTAMKYPKPAEEARVLASTLDGLALQYASFPDLTDCRAVRNRLFSRYELTDPNHEKLSSNSSPPPEL